MSNHSLTVWQVQERVENIARLAGDDEAAHLAEDDLYRDVLRAIAEGALNPAALAYTALATHHMDFVRYYA